MHVWYYQKLKEIYIYLVYVHHNLTLLFTHLCVISSLMYPRIHIAAKFPYKGVQVQHDTLNFLNGVTVHHRIAAAVPIYPAVPKDNMKYPHAAPSCSSL